MAKAKIRIISFLLLFIFVITYAVLSFTTDYINHRYSLLFVLVFTLWGILTKPNKRDDNSGNN